MKPKIMIVTAGTGPVEVRRFVADLADHLTARCLERGALVSDVVIRGDEAAPLSVEIHLAIAPDSIESLSGTHALVARSADRGKRSRKRWYAGVRVCDEDPAVNKAAAPIPRADVTITSMRASGPGGQNVNKTESAVRVFHPASGVTVRVADERSQRDNVRVALVKLAKIVAQRAEERAGEARAGRRLQHYRVERGRPSFIYELDRSGGLSLCEAICSR